MELRDRHVLITGASRGIGASLAGLFAGRGARVTLVARSAGSLSAVAERTGGTALAGDLTDRAFLDTVAARAEAAQGPVDVLVNNAGIDMAGPLEDVTPDDLDRILALNMRAPMDLTRQVLPGMRARGRGHIVNVSSLSGVASVPGIAVYGATKAGLTHFTAGLRADLRGTGVGTTVVQVGVVSGTEMTDSVMGYEPFARAWNRFCRLGLLTNTGQDRLCAAIVEAVERDRRHVRLPRRGRPMMVLPEISRRLAEALQVGLPGTAAPGRADR